MYVYFISQMRIHLSYWGIHKKWCMEIGFYIFYICSLKHTFDIRVFITHHKNLRKPAEIRNFLTRLLITVNPYVTLLDNIHLLNTAYFCENLIKYRLFIKVLKQLFLPKIYSNIRNNPYVATNNFLKTAENRHHCPCACQVICVFVANYHQKQKIYILATQ